MGACLCYTHFTPSGDTVPLLAETATTKEVCWSGREKHAFFAAAVCGHRLSQHINR
jgi:hypothetical protein